MLKLRIYGVTLPITAIGIAIVVAAAEPNPRLSSDWSAWRERVRAELAELPRKTVPSTDGRNPIDVHFADWWTTHRLTKPPRVSDRTFIRRAYLDLVGLLPDENTVARFVADPAVDKRRQLVHRLLAETTAYAEHWMTFWNDLLRNDEQTNIDNLRKPITSWLFRSLSENKPYDQMVAELLNPIDADADGFLKGVNWRGAVNHSQTPVMQAAQTSAQVFLGINLKCASCHDHFLRDWKLDQAHAYAAFFAEGELEIYRCDKSTGESAAPEFLFPGLGAVDPSADLATRRAAVAIMVTRPQNPRFAKVLVNRLFRRLIGQGLIDRPDDLDYRTAIIPKLLDWLADDFMRHDYDVKHTLRLIATSELYQQAPADIDRLLPTAETKVEPLFVGPRVRRMTAEQFLDGVCCVTGHWPKTATMSAPIPNPNVRAWRHRFPTLLAELLGRPNREQVCSERNDEATVLQALELINGTTLTGHLRDGAKALLGSALGREPDVDKVIDTLCLRAYSRPAEPEELELARNLLGTPADPLAVRQAGWEDVLWILVMSPEFQFVN